ncbi:MAG: peptide chain release factor N(5)-glutamine methyltransferase [Candidatus Moranbacteria bacterium]|nr:peptide chain release factor N(5)-glutamine methyltransferase [Candidatus Moranbacteria bacterium]
MISSSPFKTKTCKDNLEKSRNNISFLLLLNLFFPSMKTLQEIVNEFFNISRQEKYLLLAWILKIKKEYLLAHPEHPLTHKEVASLRILFKKREKGIPIAYLIQNKEFYGLDFFVNKNVLIPRPETELIIEEILREKEKIPLSEKILFLEIGTGSGCITITLANLFKDNPKQNVFFATDISKKALKVAKINARKHEAIKKIHFLSSDLLSFSPKILNSFSQLFSEISHCFFIANLPYIPQKYYDKAHTHDYSLGITFEPEIALVSGKTGFDLYQKLFWQLRNFLLPKNTVFFFEFFGNTQQKNLFKKETSLLFDQYSFKFLPDLSGKMRVVVIKNFSE